MEVVKRQLWAEQGFASSDGRVSRRCRPPDKLPRRLHRAGRATPCHTSPSAWPFLALFLYALDPTPGPHPRPSLCRAAALCTAAAWLATCLARAQAWQTRRATRCACASQGGWSAMAAGWFVALVVLLVTPTALDSPAGPHLQRVCQPGGGGGNSGGPVSALERTTLGGQGHAVSCWGRCGAARLEPCFASSAPLVWPAAHHTTPPRPPRPRPSPAATC